MHFPKTIPIFAENSVMNRKEYIGTTLRNKRIKRRISQMKLALLTGIEKKSISKIERGKIQCDASTLDKLCKEIGVSIRMAEGNTVFEDLVFEKHPFHILAEEMGESYPNYDDNRTCYQAKFRFDNGLNFSVVIGTPFLSNGVDTYEACLWSEEYQETFGHLTDMQVNSLMEYAQLIEHVELLPYLKGNGFEWHDHHMFPLGYIRKYNDWYIHVNPCGSPTIGASKDPRNFSNIIYYTSFEGVKQALDNLDVYTKWCEGDEKEKE